MTRLSGMVRTVSYCKFARCRLPTVMRLQIRIFGLSAMLIPLPRMPSLADILQVRLLQLDVNIYNGRQDYLTAGFKGEMPLSGIPPS